MGDSERRTKLGTPCSSRWDGYWVDLVELREAELGRRICGAGTAWGAPCEHAPDAANGRCRFHGGIPHMGGRPGNVNALRDGLHARRLRPCTDRCPHWSTCPMAGPEVSALPLSARPACVYERSEYESTVRGTLESLDIDPDFPGEEGPAEVRFARAMAVEAAESYALTKVLAQRAAGVLKDKPMDDLVKDAGATRHGIRTQASGAVEACLKFAREQRHWHRRLVECGKGLLEVSRGEMDRDKDKEKETDWGREGCHDRDTDHDHDHDYDRDRDREVVGARTGDGGGGAKWLGRGGVVKASKKKKEKKKSLRREMLVSMNAGAPAEVREMNIIDAHARALQLE